MGTKEQRNRRRRIVAVCYISVFVIVAVLLCTFANAAFEPEQFKTDLSVIGAFTVAAALMRIIAWLDTPRERK